MDTVKVKAVIITKSYTTNLTPHLYLGSTGLTGNRLNSFVDNAVLGDTFTEKI